jgi:amino acid adenylation domain-containing protein
MGGGPSKGVKEMLHASSTVPAVPTSLFDLFLASRAAHASRPAIWVEGCSTTYDELHQAAAQLAGAMQAARSHNGSGQSQCGLLVNRTPTAYTGVLASLIAGSVYVPLNQTFPVDRLRSILSASDIDAIVVDRRSMPAAAALLEDFPRALTVLMPDIAEAQEWFARAPQHRYLTRTEIERADLASPPSESPADAGAYLLFTSGSTGTPKGVLITHSNALAYVRNVSERYRPGPEDRFSQVFDFSFDLSVHDMFVAWSAGACLYCAPEGSLAGTGEFIRRCGLTFWLSVPATAAFMRQVRMLKPGSYPTLRWSLFCGEALPMALARAWQEAAPNSIVENLYGPTEATVAFTTYRLPKERSAGLDAMQTVPIGMPLQDQKVMVVDESGKPLPDGEAGELCLGGSQVAGGYWRAPEKTAERFQAPQCPEAAGERWYRTGDLALMTKAYGLIFRGRIDRQTKIRGYRVELMEVENAMRAAAGTDTVGAVAWPLDDGGLASGIVGFVSGTQASAEAIIEGCRGALPAYMVPTRIYQLDKWLLNRNGKTDYKPMTEFLKQAGSQP